jgi:hypothetical protein
MSTSQVEPLISSGTPAAPVSTPKDFRSYYQYYLTQHQNKNCRRLHFLGTLVGLGVFIWLLTTPYWWLAWLAPLADYPFAWFGHFAFERNVPATFRNPFYAAACDLVMTWDILRGRVTL